MFELFTMLSIYSKKSSSCKSINAFKLISVKYLIT